MYSKPEPSGPLTETYMALSSGGVSSDESWVKMMPPITSTPANTANTIILALSAASSEAR
ncbi:MAG: hypothetical protein R3C16_01410 [Hyphomonadaceae bacterium]